MKAQKLMLFFPLLFLISCISETNNIVSENTETNVSGYHNFLWLSRHNPQIIQFDGVDKPTNDLSTWKMLYSDYKGDGVICSPYYMAESTEGYYKKTDSVVSGKMQLFNLPSFEDMFVNENTIRISDDTVYTFSEKDLLVKSSILNFDYPENRDVIIEPSDAHVFYFLPITHGDGYSNSLLYFFDTFDGSVEKEIYAEMDDDNEPYLYLELCKETEIRNGIGIRNYDGILVVFFDKDTIIQGSYTNIENPYISYERDAKISYEIDAKKGWNTIWVHWEQQTNRGWSTHTTYKTDLTEMPQLTPFLSDHWVRGIRFE